MTKEMIQDYVDQAENVSPFIECEVTIKIFGRVIWHFVFPPKK